MKQFWVSLETYLSIVLVSIGMLLKTKEGLAQKYLVLKF